MKVTVGFVGGDTVLDKAIEALSGSQYADISHTFILLFDSVYESEGVKKHSDPYPGVWLHSASEYEGNKHTKYVVVDIPNMDALQDKARELLGTAYGYTDCIATGVKFLTGKDLLRNGELSMHCSETVARLLRAGGLNACEDLSADQISPVALYQNLLDCFDGQQSEELC